MGVYSPEKLLEPSARKLRQKKCERLHVMREQERTSSMNRAQQYRKSLASAKNLMQARMAEAWEAQREDELRQLHDQLQHSLAGIGQGQSDAAAFQVEQQRRRAAKEACKAADDAAKRERFSQALDRERSERGTQRSRVDTHAAVRAGIFRAERCKAQAMTQELQQRGDDQRQAQVGIAHLEEERQRRRQHSAVDFRFSRLHEQQAAVAFAPLESAREAQPLPPPPDPAVVARETSAR